MKTKYELALEAIQAVYGNQELTLTEAGDELIDLRYELQNLIYLIEDAIEDELNEEL